MAKVARTRTPRKSPLLAAEREIVLIIADDEDGWTVYTDSRRALSNTLLRVARRWGLSPQPVGEHGWEVRLPLAAVRFVGPVRVTPKEQARRARLRERLRKGRNGAEVPIAIGTVRGPGPRGYPGAFPASDPPEGGKRAIQVSAGVAQRRPML